MSTKILYPSFLYGTATGERANLASGIALKDIIKANVPASAWELINEARVHVKTQPLAVSFVTGAAATASGACEVWNSGKTENVADSEYFSMKVKEIAAATGVLLFITPYGRGSVGI